MGMGLLWQTDYLNNERESCMKKENKKRAATIAALSCIAILLGIFALSDNHDTKIQSTKVVPTVTPAPAATDTISQTPALTPQSSPSWTPPEKTTSPIELPTEIEDGDFFTLTIEGKNVSVAYGVDEDTLDKTPGWLPTSALPGQDGMCVVYGHRNRTHLRVLEKVELGDTITVTMKDKTVYTYTVSDIKIYETTAEFKLPATDGKALMLATCYPFRYSGNAPGKYVITAVII